MYYCNNIQIELDLKQTNKQTKKESNKQTNKIKQTNW